MKKKITFTKKELDKYIQESVCKFLSSDKGKELISEYAITLGDYKNKIGDRLPIIIIHICLIKYQQLFDGNSNVIEHWKGEIFDFIDYIFNQTPKAANTYNDRLKAVRAKFIELDLFNASKIEKIITKKFNKEYSKIKTDAFYYTCQDFVDNIATNLVNVISSNDYDVLSDFLKDL